MRATFCFLLFIALLFSTYTSAMRPQLSPPHRYENSLSRVSSVAENEISSKPTRKNGVNSKHPRRPICIIAQNRQAAARCNEILCHQSGALCIVHQVVGRPRCHQHILHRDSDVLDGEIHPGRWQSWDQTKTACEGCTCSKVEIVDGEASQTGITFQRRPAIKAARTI
jgi:hypothetical protein